MPQFFRLLKTDLTSTPIPCTGTLTRLLGELNQDKTPAVTFYIRPGMVIACLQ
jgi:hypothetical protein